MFSLPHATDIAKTRHRELERTVQNYRLSVKARSNGSALPSTVLAWIGGRMIVVGEKLQRSNI